MVHDLKPPFLDKETEFKSQIPSIQVVRVPNSDMAVLAKKGSDAIKELREKNEQKKVVQRQDK